jgi:drug/metabolite transporter (DMT)-like permease
MIAVDDGITSGNLNVADVLFLIAAILAFLAALLAIPRNPPSPPYSMVLGWLAVTCLAVGFLLL